MRNVSLGNQSRDPEAILSRMPDGNDVAGLGCFFAFIFGAIGGGAALVYCGVTGRIGGAVCFVPGAVMLAGAVGFMVGFVVCIMAANEEDRRRQQARIKRGLE
jgi:hypothetical protein